ncbi:hypothetical protein HDU84_003250 [Entophlyctis sp. JEL0112]|nr:hypothetical protein HDU84_003250 [Entophlyctis sp. JEL0112]
MLTDTGDVRTCHGALRPCAGSSPTSVPPSSAAVAHCSPSVVVVPASAGAAPSSSAVTVRREDGDGRGTVIVAMGPRRSWLISDLKLKLKPMTGLLIHQQVVMFGEYQLTDSIKISKEELDVIDEHGGLALRRRDQKNGSKRLFSKGIRSLATYLTRTFTGPDFIRQQQQDVLEKAERQLREQKARDEQESRDKNQSERQHMDELQLSLDLEAELEAFWSAEAAAVTFDGNKQCAEIGENSRSMTSPMHGAPLSIHDNNQCLVASTHCDIDTHGGAQDLLAFSIASSTGTTTSVGTCAGNVDMPLLDLQLANAFEMNDDVNVNCDVGFQQVFSSSRRVKRKREDGIFDLDDDCKLNNDITANTPLNIFDDQQLFDQAKRLQEFFDLAAGTALIVPPSEPRSSSIVDRPTKRIRLSV